MKLTFVIPVYNAAAWIHPAVDSCLKQTHQDIEVVIVNDGSTDSTPKYLGWLAAKADPRIKIINTPNQGRSVARNTGNIAAAGDVICVLDSDDLSYPKRAEIVAREFAKGTQFLFGSAAIIDAVGTIRGEEVAEAFKLGTAMETKLNRIVHSTVAYTKAIAMAHPYRGGEIADLGIDDWAFQLEVATSGVELKHTVSPLAVYRILRTGISQTRDQKKVEEAKSRFMETLKVAA